MPKTRVHSWQSEKQSGCKRKQDKRHCSGESVLKSLWWLMRYIGIFYDHGKRLLCDCGLENASRSPHESHKSKSMKYFHITYIAALHLITWSNTLRIVVCSTQIPFEVMSTAYQFYVSSAMLVLSTNILSSVTLVKFSRELCPLMRRLCSIERTHSTQLFWDPRRFSRVAWVVSISFESVIVCGCFVSVFHDVLRTTFTSMLMVTSCPFDLDFSVTTILINLWFQGAVWMTFAGTLVAITILLDFCKACEDLFDKCNQNLRELTKQKPAEVSRSLRRALAFHHDVCGFVSDGNHLFKYIVLGVYIMAVPFICFATNVVVRTSPDSGKWIAAICMLFVMAAILGVVILKTAGINTKWKEAWDGLHGIVPTDSEGLQLVSLFLSRLSGPDVGMTVSDLFVIDRGHILTWKEAWDGLHGIVPTDSEGLQLVSLFLSRLSGPDVGMTVSDLFVIDRGHILTWKEAWDGLHGIVPTDSEGLQLVSLFLSRLSGPDVGMTVSDLFVIDRGHILTWKEAWDGLHGIVLTDSEGLQLVSLFLSRLSGPDVGMTVSDLFVIDRGHILTIFGLLLTYTVLIVQFDPSDIGGTHHNETLG